MIKAKHNIIVYSFFKLFTKIKLKKNFEQIFVEGKIDVENHSVLLIANHISWWDGFWVLHLCMNNLKKKFHFMMLEKELKKRWIFSYSGGFSISQGAKSIIESLNYSSTLLKNKNNLVLMFPQGKIKSIYNDNFMFEKGIERIMTIANKNSKTFFLVSMIDYLEFSKPNLYLYLTDYQGNADIVEIQKAYNEFYKQCLENRKKIEI